MFAKRRTRLLYYNFNIYRYAFHQDDGSGAGCINEIVRKDSYRLKRFSNISDGVFFDIGGNNGLVSLILARQNPQSVVVVVEPILELCDLIRYNADINKISNVIVLNRALAASNEKVILSVATSCSGASSTMVKHQEEFNVLENGFTEREVDGVTFDDLCDQFLADGAFMPLLKIDCEGAEYTLRHSKRFADRIVHNLEGEFHDTSYINSYSQSALDLFLYCIPLVKNEIHITRLTRSSSEILEDSLAFRLREVGR